MPIASVRGVNINYQIVGDRGPWVALSPGGRRDLGGVLPPAELVAKAGYRVLIHDRRNCGASDVVIEGEESEYEIWADDLYVEAWDEKRDELAAIFVDFLKRVPTAA